jgi:hypothetical protein
MDSLYSIETCLVTIIISIYFVFLFRIFCLFQITTPNSDLKSRINTIFIKDT